MALPYFPQNGWQADILTVNADYVEGVRDPLLSQTLPTDVQATVTNAIPVQYTRRLGFGSLALRALPFLLRAGSRLLHTRQYKLVFFSTTMFPVMALGPYWRSKFGMPYVLDFQDPWLSDYYQNKINQNPPGGRFKYGFSQFLAKYLEPYTLKRASHVITVSPSYPSMLQHRYPWLQDDQFTVIPFAAAENDFAQLPSLKVQHKFFAPGDGKRHWVYIGRGGNDMAFALRGFFSALHRARLTEPEKWHNLKLHFIGTDYAPGDMAQKTVEPIAVECGVGDMVLEHPHRIPYFEMLQCLMDADALIVPGSDDPGYTASKIYPYILAKRPLLAIFHEKSSIIEVLNTTGSGTLVTFKTGENSSRLADDITEKWFKKYPSAIPTTNWNAFEPYSARNMTRRLCASFDKCLSLEV